MSADGESGLVPSEDVVFLSSNVVVSCDNRCSSSSSSPSSSPPGISCPPPLPPLRRVTPSFSVGPRLSSSSPFSSSSFVEAMFGRSSAPSIACSDLYSQSRSLLGRPTYDIRYPIIPGTKNDTIVPQPTYSVFKPHTKTKPILHLLNGSCDSCYAPTSLRWAVGLGLFVRKCRCLQPMQTVHMFVQCV